jgi:hypothetical protein
LFPPHSFLFEAYATEHCVSFFSLIQSIAQKLKENGNAQQLKLQTSVAAAISFYSLYPALCNILLM